MTDPLFRLLDDLPSGSLAPSRGERIRVRCHDALARQRRHVARDGNRRRSKYLNDEVGAARVWAPVVGGLGGLYLTELLREVLGMYGWL